MPLWPCPGRRLPAPAVYLAPAPAYGWGTTVMLAAIRQFADRVKRRERVALLLVGLCAGIGLAAGLTGRRAFLERPCSTFHRPDSSESRCVDHIAVVSSLDAPGLAPPPPLRLDPPIARAIEPERRIAPGPLGWLLDDSPVSLRGPPAQTGSISVANVDWLAKESVACRHKTRGSSGSS